MMRRWGNAVIAILWCSALAACNKDTVTAPFDARFASPVVRDSSKVTIQGKSRIDATSANLNVCDVGPAVRDLAGNFQYWNTKRSPINVAYEKTDTLLEVVHVMKFDARGKQTDDAQCVTRAGNSVKAVVSAVYAAPLPNAGTLNKGSPVSIIGYGTVCWGQGGGTATYWCDGTRCDLVFQARPIRQSANSQAINAIPFGGQTKKLEGDGYECDDGSSFVDNGDGTADYYYPDTGYGGTGCAGNPGGGGDSTGGGQGEQLRRRTSICEDTLHFFVECDHSSLTRGDSIDCDAEVNPSSQVITMQYWQFHPTSPIVDANSSYTTNTYWKGRMVTSGYVSAAATINGGTFQDSVYVSVEPRSTWTTTGSLAVTISQVADLFSADPANEHQLGNTDPHISSISSISSTVSGGPNDGYSYLTANASLNLNVFVNYPAMQPTSSGDSTFIKRYINSTIGSHCSASYISGGLVTKVQNHEGTSFQSGSHTNLFRASVNANSTSARQEMEQFVAAGPLTSMYLESTLAFFNTAYSASLAADPDSAYPCPLDLFRP